MRFESRLLVRVGGLLSLELDVPSGPNWKPVIPAAVGDDDLVLTGVMPSDGDEAAPPPPDRVVPAADRLIDNDLSFWAGLGPSGPSGRLGEAGRIEVLVGGVAAALAALPPPPLLLWSSPDDEWLWSPR